MIYINESGEFVEINRHEYSSEKQYYCKISEIFKPYINATEKEISRHNTKVKFENLEIIENMMQDFNKNNK